MFNVEEWQIHKEAESPGNCGLQGVLSGRPEADSHGGID